MMQFIRWLILIKMVCKMIQKDCKEIKKDCDEKDCEYYKRL